MRQKKNTIFFVNLWQISTPLDVYRREHFFKVFSSFGLLSCVLSDGLSLNKIVTTCAEFCLKGIHRVIFFQLKWRGPVFVNICQKHVGHF